MGYSDHQELIRRSSEPDSIEQSIAYLADQFDQFLYKGEKVLICFHSYDYGNLSYLMEQAVLRCGGMPLVLDEDLRWKTLLRTAFQDKVGCVIGPPLVLLGLGKLAKHMGTPLYIRNAVVGGYPCLDWIEEGIAVGLDCKVWRSMTFGLKSLVGGFSCGNSKGVHVRDELYGVDFVGNDGLPVNHGQSGKLELYELTDPNVRWKQGDYGTRSVKACPCGKGHIVQISRLSDETDPDVIMMVDALMCWTSILDCRVTKKPEGVWLEVVCFPGERLPKFPPMRHLLIRAWRPDEDKPFWYFPERNM